MTFGERLYQLRKEKKMSQEELAERLEVSRQSVSRWENGSAAPDFDKTVRISEIFGVTTDYLIKGEVQAPASAPPEAPQKEFPFWRKVLSAVLLTLGGLSLLYGILFGGYLEYYLLFPLPLLSCGLFCLFSKKYTPLKCWWSLFWCGTSYLYVSFSWSWSLAFLIFRKIPAQMKRYILPGWILLFLLIALVLYTARTLRKKAIQNRKKHLAFTVLFPILYVVQEVLFTLASRYLLTVRMELVQSVLFQIINLLFQTLRLFLIGGFAAYLARWLHYKQN